MKSPASAGLFLLGVPVRRVHGRFARRAVAVRGDTVAGGGAGEAGFVGVCATQDFANALAWSGPCRAASWRLPVWSAEPWRGRAFSSEATPRARAKLVPSAAVGLAAGVHSGRARPPARRSAAGVRSVRAAVPRRRQLLVRPAEPRDDSEPMANEEWWVMRLRPSSDRKDGESLRPARRGTAGARSCARHAARTHSPGPARHSAAGVRRHARQCRAHDVPTHPTSAGRRCRRRRWC